MTIDTAAFVTGNHIQYSEASERAIKGGRSPIKLLLSDSVNCEAASLTLQFQSESPISDLQG